MTAKIKFDETKRFWDRMDGETDREWDMFQMFLETRDRPAVVLAFYGEDNHEAGTQWVNKVSKTYKWFARRDAYDSWIAKHRDTATANLVRHEINLIAQRRRRLFATLYKKVKAVVDKADDDNPREIRGALTLVRMLDDLWRKVEENGAYSVVTNTAAEELDLKTDKKQILQARLDQIAAMHADQQPPANDVLQ